MFQFILGTPLAKEREESDGNHDDEDLTVDLEESRAEKRRALRTLRTTTAELSAHVARPVEG